MTTVVGAPTEYPYLRDLAAGSTRAIGATITPLLVMPTQPTSPRPPVLPPPLPNSSPPVPPPPQCPKRTPTSAGSPRFRFRLLLPCLHCRIFRACRDRPLGPGRRNQCCPRRSAGTAVGSGPCCSVEAAADQGCLSNGLVAALISISVDDVDERLYEIRQRLTATGAQPSGGDSMFDFYRPPLQSIWDPGSTQSEGASDIDLLAYKKQLVVFGAPGTGKTHRTRQLAEQIIRRAALEKWGAARFFTEQAALDGYIAANVHWLQLHPGYGYEEFIRGLRLTPDGSTTYVPGYLPLLVKAINAVPAKDRLPVVLVLDEINRTDLSRMFGEAFSLLENRDSVAILPGVNSDNGDDQVATLALPSNLFVIGTMNLIDQSVEELDFALRRRFFWRPAEFDASAIIAVNANRWRKHSPTKWGWDRAVDDMTLLAERAGLLNQAISASPHLGSQYELGHTYYFDASFFVGNWLRGRKTLSGGGVLWATNGKPRPGLNDLWTYSLEPLLMQYLGGLEADVAASERARLKAVLFSGTLP